MDLSTSLAFAETLASRAAFFSWNFWPLSDASAACFFFAALSPALFLAAAPLPTPRHVSCICHRREREGDSM
jgi:hypothetical protein